MKISKRLRSLAELVDSNDIIADIGCDHALLDVYLVFNNIVNKAYASDVNSNALRCGINNVNKYNLSDRIVIRLDDGINNIPEDINTLIISGMGSSTIVKILDSSRLNQIDKLIIQSNNDYYLLRKYLVSKGYYIFDENSVYDKGKYYINIVFKKGYKKYNKNELKYGPILSKNNCDYYNYLLNKTKDIYKMVPLYKIKYRFELKKDIIILNKLSKKLDR